MTSSRRSLPNPPWFPALLDLECPPLNVGSQQGTFLTLHDKTLTETGTRPYPEIAALRLLVELRARVGQLSAELAPRQSSGSDTMRLAVLKLSKVAHQAGIGFETSHTVKLRSAYGEIRNTLLELCNTTRLAGLTAYVAACEHVIAQLEPLRAPGDMRPPLINVLYEWIEASLAYLGAPGGEESFPEADALVQCLFDARWEGSYEPASAEALRKGLIQNRRRAQRK